MPVALHSESRGTAVPKPRFTRPACFFMLSLSVLLFQTQMFAQNQNITVASSDAIADAAAVGGKFTVFNVPGAGTSVGQGTFAVAVNARGDVAGSYLDPSNVYHGYIRSASGKYTTFDLPTEDTDYYQGVVSMNRTDAIAGNYVDLARVSHGFLRSPEGAFIVFDAPNAGTGPNQGTFSSFINDRGEIVGYSADSNNNFSSFRRKPNGSILSFQVPGAGTGASEGTFAYAVNNAGEITGDFQDSSDIVHGFLLAADGTFTIFDCPGYDGTYIFAMNSSGATTGSAYSDETGESAGIYRAANGALETFAMSQQTIGYSINSSGVIAGYALDANLTYHGLQRSTDGTLQFFEAPGAGQIQYAGTIAGGINDVGEIVGFEVTAQGKRYGFILKP